MDSRIDVQGSRKSVQLGKSWACVVAQITSDIKNRTLMIRKSSPDPITQLAGRRLTANQGDMNSSPGSAT